MTKFPHLYHASLLSPLDGGLFKHTLKWKAAQLQLRTEQDPRPDVLAVSGGDTCSHPHARYFLLSKSLVRLGKEHGTRSRTRNYTLDDGLKE
jgi:hypothetical protein